MARIIVHADGQSRVVELGPVPVTFGRGSENTVMLRVSEASRRHFQIEQVPNGFKLADLESRNGTRVNGKQVNTCVLRHGDQIEIGTTTITFDDPEAPAIPQQVRPASQHPGQASTHHGGRITARARQPRFSGTRTPGGASAIAAIAIAIGLGVVAVLVLSVATKTSPDEEEGAALFRQAEAIEGPEPLTSLATYQKIRPESGQWHRRAEVRIRHLQDRLASSPAPASPDEQKDFDALKNFERDNAFKHEEIAKLANEFLLKHPAGRFNREVRQMSETHRAYKTSERAYEVEQALKAADTHSASKDFHAALGAIDGIYEKYKTDIALKQDLIKVRTAIVEKGKLHAREQVAIADKLALQGKIEEARETCRRLRTVLGDGNDADFADQCKLVDLKMESFK